MKFKEANLSFEGALFICLFIILYVLNNADALETELEVRPDFY